MSDLFGNHIVGFPTRRLIHLLFILSASLLGLLPLLWLQLAGWLPCDAFSFQSDVYIGTSKKLARSLKFRI